MFKPAAMLSTVRYHRSPPMTTCPQRLRPTIKRCRSQRTASGICTGMRVIRVQLLRHRVYRSLQQLGLPRMHAQKAMLLETSLEAIDHCRGPPLQEAQQQWRLSRPLKCLNAAAAQHTTWHVIHLHLPCQTVYPRQGALRGTSQAQRAHCRLTVHETWLAPSAAMRLPCRLWCLLQRGCIASDCSVPALQKQLKLAGA